MTRLEDSEHALRAVTGFVDGKLDAVAFQAQLLETVDLFEELLDDSAELPQGSYIRAASSSTFHYLLELDLEDPGDVLNAQGALVDLLRRRGIDCEPTDNYEALFDLVSGAQPRWLDVETAWIKEHLLSGAGDRSGKELETWLREQFRARFRCLKEPPRWIQSPSWPIRGGRPLVFLGQLEVTDHFHDEGAVYVFHDPETGSCETIIQVM
jgi:hypothetical protein